MEKTYLIGLLAIMFFALILVGAGCSKNGTDSGTKDTTTETSDIPECEEKINDPNNPIFALKDNCYSGYAIQRGDENLCEKIESQQMKDQCYMGVASTTKDIKLCGKIKDSTIKRSCEAFVKSMPK